MNAFKFINPVTNSVKGWSNKLATLFRRIYWKRFLFRLSQRIIANSLDSSFAEAYNLSNTDTYDFSSKKQDLKKWETELGIVKNDFI